MVRPFNPAFGSDLKRDLPNLRPPLGSNYPWLSRAIDNTFMLTRLTSSIQRIKWLENMNVAMDVPKIKKTTATFVP